MEKNPGEHLPLCGSLIGGGGFDVLYRFSGDDIVVRSFRVSVFSVTYSVYEPFTHMCSIACVCVCECV